MKVNYSVSSASHASKRQAKPDYELSESARRNSVMSHFADYQGKSEKSPYIKDAANPVLLKRDSILKATSDVDHQKEIRKGLAFTAQQYDKLDLPGKVSSKQASNGPHAKYKISDDGSMLIVSKCREVACTALEATAMLWDHREETALKIWKDLIDHVDVVAEVSPLQRIMYLRYAQPKVGCSGKTSARDTAIIASKFDVSNSFADGLPIKDGQIISCSAITTSLIPVSSQYVRSDTKVLGFLVTPLTKNSCSITLVAEFGMQGAFKSPITQVFLRCTGMNKLAAQVCAEDCASGLQRLKEALEASAGP
mmetsp:Transcript_4274/g.7161  ORF Transcript_4274/g.7161 Transcript_4274/m.7161 type:complete len:309 (+) Transcript_4274:72-998(+)|eukprot:CAMPEP_0119336718 /NCGR_PEP_ID=MMETSP1333-20130426/92393_1 /TAXON_ID=418940 /ORGANISM="Scyphosphaera apsteinii, Strain RCC1455" /LENGTH=308 /DNA_ID=CAMNT_0007347567 /DNA_START=61 /DNA_END=987 /DNA_ORIENTATION=-